MVKGCVSVCLHLHSSTSCWTSTLLSLRHSWLLQSTGGYWCSVDSCCLATPDVAGVSSFVFRVCSGLRFRPVSTGAGDSPRLTSPSAKHGSNYNCNYNKNLERERDFSSVKQWPKREFVPWGSTENKVCHASLVSFQVFSYLEIKALII